MIEFKCELCGRFLKAPQHLAGQATTCPTCLKSVHVPASSAPQAASKAAGPHRKLCVDCGKGFPAGQMHTHNGQAVCTECYNLRKPVVLKPRKKRKPRRRRILIVLLIVLTVAAVVYFLCF